MTVSDPAPELSQEEIRSAIWGPAVAFYLHAIAFNVRAALSSFGEAGKAMGLIDGDETPERIDQDFVLNHLQNAIIHAGAISRFLWPTKGKGPAGRKTQARGAYLRRALQVPDDSPLADRKLRNAIEHFDERLDEYLADGIVGIVMPHHIGLPLDTSGVPAHLFRAFYLDSLTFQILSETYERIGRDSDEIAANLS